MPSRGSNELKVGFRRVFAPSRYPSEKGSKPLFAALQRRFVRLVFAFAEPCRADAAAKT
jgi:hypothetical protein